MRVYRRESSGPGKWIFAGVLFILAMTFTLAEVNGFNYPYNSAGTAGDSPNRPNTDQHSTLDGQPLKTLPPDNNTPSAVPEPTTILLLASGLGVTLLNRSRKKA